MSNDKELWLEFGWIYEDENNWHEMLWYNEGRPEEIGYFLDAIKKKVSEDKPKGLIYFKTRYDGITTEITI